jgi:hypothetical protein
MTMDTNKIIAIAETYRADGMVPAEWIAQKAGVVDTDVASTLLTESYDVRQHDGRGAVVLFSQPRVVRLGISRYGVMHGNHRIGGEFFVFDTAQSWIDEHFPVNGGYPVAWES